MAADLVIQSLRAGYGHLDILRDVSLTVRQGEFVALLGPNGAGKSTLLKTLYGMATHKAGSISWKGREIAGGKPRAFLSQGFGYVPQGRCNFPTMSVDENLEMAAYTIWLRPQAAPELGPAKIISPKVHFREKSWRPKVLMITPLP